MKAIIFDLDGTLINTIDDLANAANYTMLQLGFKEHSVNAYKYMVGNGIPVLLKRAMQLQNPSDEILQKAIDVFGQYYSAHKLDFTKPYNGITSTLAILKSKGIKLCVATNKDNNFAQELVENIFAHTFNFVQGRSGDVPAKPNPFMVNQIIARLGIKNEDILYVGDSDVDMQTAKNARLTACGVSWGFREKKELVDAGADFVIDEPSELIIL